MLADAAAARPADGIQGPDAFRFDGYTIEQLTPFEMNLLVRLWNDARYGWVDRKQASVAVYGSESGELKVADHVKNLKRKVVADTDANWEIKTKRNQFQLARVAVAKGRK